MGEWTFEKDDFLTPAPYEALYKFHTGSGHDLHSGQLRRQRWR